MKSLKNYIFEALNVQINGFCILKPEFLEHEFEFENLLKNRNWEIVQKIKRTLSIPEVKELYVGLKDKDFYDELCRYMASGDSISYILRKKCKDPIKDLKTIKNKVRKEWGKDEMRNAMHSSDSKENVEREYKLVLQDNANITTHITEKLRINSNITLNGDYIPTEDVFFELLTKCGEIDMKEVFGKDSLPYDEKGRDVLSIYYDGLSPRYSYYSKTAGYDCEGELYLDMFTDKDIIRIYNYMLNNYNENA